MYLALKNADDMLQDVIKAMDKNGDRVIEYDGTYRSGWNISAKQVGSGLWLFVRYTRFLGTSSLQTMPLTKRLFNILNLYKQLLMCLTLEFRTFVEQTERERKDQPQPRISGDR
jgi:hypothetical protein